MAYPRNPTWATDVNSILPAGNIFESDDGRNMRLDIPDFCWSKPQFFRTMSVGDIFSQITILGHFPCWKIPLHWIRSFWASVQGGLYFRKMERYPFISATWISIYWVNYNNSQTWIKAIWGWFPLLTMIPVRSQWGRYNLAIYIYMMLPLFFLLLFWLVEHGWTTTGWWYTYPSEQWWSSSVGMMTFPIYGKKIPLVN